MPVLKRASVGRARPPEVVFVSTFAVVALFALYSFGKSYAQDPLARSNALFTRESQEQDLEVRLIALLLAHPRLTIL